MDTQICPREMVKAAGARLCYLSPYSPDLNSIEQAFAKIKHWMRQAQKRERRFQSNYRERLD